MRTDIGSRLAKLTTTPYTQDYHHYNPEMNTPASSSSQSGKPNEYFTLDKDFQTTWEDGKNQYYQGANELFEMALAAEKAGFNVLKPDPRDQDQITYAQMFNEQKNQLLRLAEELKAGREIEKQYSKETAQQNVFGAPLENEAATYNTLRDNVTDLRTPLDSGKNFETSRMFAGEEALTNADTAYSNIVNNLYLDAERLREEGKLREAEELEKYAMSLPKPSIDAQKVHSMAATDERLRQGRERNRISASKKRGSGSHTPEEKSRDFQYWNEIFEEGNTGQKKEASAFAVGYKFGDYTTSNQRVIVDAQLSRNGETYWVLENGDIIYPKDLTPTEKRHMYEWSYKQRNGLFNDPENYVDIESVDPIDLRFNAQKALTKTSDVVNRKSSSTGGRASTTTPRLTEEQVQKMLQELD